jgi:hypothetical protein
MLLLKATLAILSLSFQIYGAIIQWGKTGCSRWHLNPCQSNVLVRLEKDGPYQCYLIVDRQWKVRRSEFGWADDYLVYSEL